ncbi:uncharacterized protein LJ264_002925 [Porphyrio hochstetteri]
MPRKPRLRAPAASFPGHPPGDRTARPEPGGTGTGSAAGLQVSACPAAGRAAPAASYLPLPASPRRCRRIPAGQHPGGAASRRGSIPAGQHPGGAASRGPPGRDGGATEPRWQPVRGGTGAAVPGRGARPRGRPGSGAGLLTSLAGPGETRPGGGSPDAMEPFPLPESRAAERILRPMAAQLCRLLLAPARPRGSSRPGPSLGDSAGLLAKAAEELAAAAGRLAEESGDQALEGELRPAAEALALAGRCVLRAARELQGEPDDPRRREELAAAATRLLTETAKILQIEDAAAGRRAVQAASWLLECLGVLRGAGDGPGALAASRACSQALLLLSSLTAQRLQQLRDCPRRRSLAHALQLLLRGVPLLHGAPHSQLRRSHGQQGALAGHHAFQLMESAIGELTSLLMESTGSKEPGDRGGTFSQHVSRLLALLSHPDPVLLSDTELSAHTEAIILYCVLLAGSSRQDLKLDLLRRCRVLLQMRNSICSHISQREQEGWPGPCWGEGSLEQGCHTMREEVEHLDRAALTATLCQVLDTFVEGTEPLRQLVEGALSLAGTGSFPEGQGGFLKQLQPLTTTFFTHAQQTLRAADFALARCTNPHTAGEIGEQAECLRRLLAHLPALLTGRSGDAAGERGEEQLRSLSHAWAVATARLLRCFEATVSTPELLQLCLREMAGHRQQWERALQSQDAEGLSWHAARLTAWARWVAGATTRHVDRATDPVFRNGLLVWVEQLAHSILELEAVAALPPERLSQLQSREDISKVVSCLMEAARRVQEGLDGSNHPDILSPRRARVRSAAVARGLGLSLAHAGLETITDAAAAQEDGVGHPSPGAGSSQPGVAPGTGATHPVVTALLAATSAHHSAAIDSACSALLELSQGCVTAAREALPVADSAQAETLGQHQEIVLMTGALVSLARDTAPQQPHRPGSLLPTARSLSERLRETTECLAAVAGSWYSLAQQVLGFISSADFLRGKEALDETMAGLAGAVQLAGAIASTAWSEGKPVSSEAWESFLQVQAKFSRAQLNTKVLLEKAASFKGSCQVGEASLELHCVQWAVSTHVLLCAMDRFIGRDVLLLRELRSAGKNELCWRSLLAAVSENSLRLQEAARLSYLSCPEDSSCSEILALREEIKVLMGALLEASRALWVSPLPAPSLCVRCELLQRELALRAKALLLHLERVNTQQLQVIRDVLGPALSPLSQEGRERSREAFEEKASQLVANVQWVKSTLQDVLEASAQLPSQANLLSIAEHLLVLTSEAVGTASQLLQSPQDRGHLHQDKGHHLHLDSTVWHWSAAAHYLVRQLGAARGISPQILQLITHYLQDPRDQDPSSITELSPAPGTPGHPDSAGTRLSRSWQAGRAAREAGEMKHTGGDVPASGFESLQFLSPHHGNGPPNASLAGSPVKHERGDSDTWQGSPSKMSQVTKDMATRLLHMTQFLRKKGPITSKEQLVACARHMASEGQVLVTFGCTVAKHCLHQRCSTELLRAAEHTHTISSQLSIVARVKAVTAESKASSELLVSNAQRLLQAVSHLLKAAEAACLTGLRQPPPDSGEEEAAAFCREWRRSLWWHRATASCRSHRAASGLRQSRAGAEPSLAALVQCPQPPPGPPHH